ncbi:hypothetical protein ALI144C_01505 [Actinosynnema sp. ALI-1.44]|uniref:hypothetical protein n=1 Tax=Actinosynnema sp. ALI-1.44 TaxID=1933779 RepID=UPI00097C6C52|nr:hypothetical protein [Actinosynnema sp. ALI-1.44]ONI91161.1 hypothetical protein ALI144C_01505 [Actinosynnema sp. ALI-1.44]
MTIAPDRVGFWRWLIRGPRVLWFVVGVAAAVTLQYTWVGPSAPVVRTIALSAVLVLIFLVITYRHWRQTR